jgi:glutamate dehydrogenase (NAD(P)+)
VAAVSTLAGCIADPLGIDIGLLLALRSAHGDACVAHYGLPVAPPGHLFTTVDADVIVPGTRPGMITAQTAAALPQNVRVIAPAANAPYTEEGARVLRERDILALPDFVCNAGAVLGYRAPADATPEQVLTAAGTTIAEVITALMPHEGGPLAGGLAQAQGFLRGWWGEPPAPPFAPAA